MACTGAHPRVAVIAIISDKEGRVLAGQRLSALGTGQYSFPGGHLDQNESLFNCAERETLEETGLVIRATRIVAITNDVFGEAGKHYVSIFVEAHRLDENAQPETLEPNKCVGWEWKTWDEIRGMVGVATDAAKPERSHQVFLPVRNFVLENPGIETSLYATGNR